MRPALSVCRMLCWLGLFVAAGASVLGAQDAAMPATASAPAAAPMVVYAKDNAPKTPALEELPLKESVSQYGITWTFGKPARAGQFVNGDWYVVGPVTVTAIDPAPRHGKDVADEELDSRERRLPVEARTRNGSMLNPPPRMAVAWDSAVRNYYRAELAARLPIEMKPGDCLASSISLKAGERARFVYHSGGTRASSGGCPAKVAAVLTCVERPQPADAFRPGYMDRKQTIYLARDLKRELLPRLARVEGMPDPVQFAEVFRKPWLNTCIAAADQPMENMPQYGQWVGQASSIAGLLLCCDFSPAEKERLLVNVVQVGIDYWSAVKSGHPGWPCWGGHSSGRKLPVVFAGALLGDEEMASPYKSFPKVSFAEDEQTAYGDCWTGAKVVFTGHSGIDAATGVGRNHTREAVWGPYEHLMPEKWNKDQHQSDAYRRANTSWCWVGQALAMRLLRFEKYWAHDAFFDYVDRWMTEDDKPFRNAVFPHSPEKIEAYRDDTKTWFHQGWTGDPWVKEMWARYRTAPGMPPTDGWKQKHDDAYYRTAIEKGQKKADARPAQ